MLSCQEAFYGGAAGGGKSDALLMGALQCVDHADYAALILRKTYKDLSLPKSLMSRAKEWLGGSDARWSEQEKTWHFPSGATITFGYILAENDKYQYKSAEFQYIGFDELTQFTLTQYQYLFSRSRRLKGSDIPVRIRSASNPGDIGHEWVKQRFLIEGAANGRIFIPAKLKDNPYLDTEEYIKSLSELDPITLQQLLNGDWTARASGGTFRREWFEVVEDVPRDLVRVRYWDKAATEPKPGRDPDWTVGVLMGRSPQGLYYVLDVRRVRLPPSGVEMLIKNTASQDAGHVKIWIEQEPGSAGVDSIDYYHRFILPEYRFEGDKVTGPKKLRAEPFSGQCRAGNVKLLRGPWINPFLDELDAFGADPPAVHDDQVDAASGAYAKLAVSPFDIPISTFVQVSPSYRKESMF